MHAFAGIILPSETKLALGLAPAAGAALLPGSLIWAVAILVFGLLLMVCVVVLLKREAEPTAGWEGELASRAGRGRQLQHMGRLLRAIRNINGVIVTERDGERLLERACESLTATRGYRMTWIGLVEEGSKQVRPVSQAGFEKGYLEQIEITWDDSPTGRGPTGRAIRTGEPAVMRDIESAPEYRPWREQALKRGYRSSAALPLRFGGSVLGALNVYSEMPEAFDIEEVGILQEVADHLAYALGSIRLEEELAEARREVAFWHRIRSAFGRAPLGVMVTDEKGNITEANERMVEMLAGYDSAQELADRAAAPGLSIFQEDEPRRCLSTLLEEGRPVHFKCSVAVDGRPRLLRCRGLPVTGEGEELTETLWLVEQLEAGLEPQNGPRD
ncbi:MAG: GAF domain-containing protein [Planctomycetota bacterium]